MVAELLEDLLLYLFLGVFEDSFLSCEAYGRTCVLDFAENFEVTFLGNVPMCYRVSLLEQICLERLCDFFALRYELIQRLPFSLKQYRNASENLPFRCILLHLILFPHTYQTTPLKPKIVTIRATKHLDPVPATLTPAE